jgi:L-idonate 5-dehydrogenase
VRALSIHGKEDLRPVEVDVPEPGPDQVRIKVAYVGICGSDLHYYFHGANGAFVVREPLVPGHELSGTVDADPSGRLAPGTPVTVHPATFGPVVTGLEDARHLWPGGSYLGSASTWPHTQGGMAEYLVVGADMIRELPAELPLTRAALAEPLAVALHGVSQAGGVEGARVLVSGAGPIGLLTAFAAKALGAAHVTVADVVPEPLERATAVGADATILLGSAEVPVNSYDVVLECAGVPASITTAIGAVRPRGVVAQVGMLPNAEVSVLLAPLISKEARLVGCFRFDDEIGEAVRLLNDHPEAEAVVTHVISSADAVEAFATARNSRASGKVLVAL